MAKRVMKFGGSSVVTPERIQSVASRAVRARRAGYDLVVVVSAMGDTTDDLIALADTIAPESRRRHPREFDMLVSAGERISMALLAMAVREAGEEAISFTGSQAAIITDAAHTGARIREVRATRVREELARGRIVIVAGFQGVSDAHEVTTLGRGGSDTTAVALAAALGAERCEILTDVDGVYTADPGIVSTAKRLERLDYEEMLELCSSGAGVLHPRAVEIGARFGVPIRIASSFHEEEEGGTMVERRAREMEDLVLTGLTAQPGYARLVLCGLPTGLRATSAVLSRLSGADVSVDMVSQADGTDGRRQLQLSLREDTLEGAREICQALVEELGGDRLDVTTGLSRVAIVGSGMHGRPGVYARTFEVLVTAGVEVHGVSTSAISISLLVDTDREESALRVLHEAFEWGEGIS